MHDPLPDPDRPLDRLVRARLERDADAGRAAELWRHANRPRHTLLAWLPRLAAAAVLLVAGLMFWPGGQARATPAEVVAKAYVAHTQDAADRRYRVEVELAGMAGHESGLWTRGDRFRVEPGPVGGVWGQDADGRVWLAPTPKSGARFDEDEIPERLRRALRVRAVDLPDLLTELRGTCELTDDASTPGTRTVRAERVRGDSSLSRAQLDIDETTGVVQRLQVWRDLLGEETRLHLTLVETGTHPDSYYTLEGNLAPGGEVYGRSRSGMRLGLLLHHGLGAMLGK